MPTIFIDAVNKYIPLSTAGVIQSDINMAVSIKYWYIMVRAENIIMFMYCTTSNIYAKHI